MCVCGNLNKHSVVTQKLSFLNRRCIVALTDRSRDDENEAGPSTEASSTSYAEALHILSPLPKAQMSSTTKRKSAATHIITSSPYKRDYLQKQNSTGNRAQMQKGVANTGDPGTKQKCRKKSNSGKQTTGKQVNDDTQHKSSDSASPSVVPSRPERRCSKLFSLSEVAEQLTK